MHPLPYALPGEPHLPQAVLWIWDKQENTKQFAMPSEKSFGGDQNALQYLLWAQWANVEPFGEFLLAVWTNRLQNFVAAMICMHGEPCFRFFKFRYLVHGKELWLEPRHWRVRFTSRTGFFVILPRLHPNGDIYDAIAHVDVSQVQPGRSRYGIRFHSGAFDAVEVVGYDAERDELFFTGQGGVAGELHLFRLPTASGASGIVPQCISCPLRACPLATPVFSPGSRRLLLFCEAPFQPGRLYLKATDSILEHSVVGSLESNRSTSTPHSSSLRFEAVKLTSGIFANVQLVLPPDFDDSLSYPVLLDTDARPGRNQVWKRSPPPALGLLVRSQHAVLVRVDARGSGLRGWRVRAPVRRNLGGADAQDLLETLGKLLKRFPFLDPARVSLVGQGYGGFLALRMAALDRSRVVKCVAVRNPITDLRLYNAVFSERFMHLPSVNEEGYQATCLFSAAAVDALRSVKLFLAYSEADEEVLARNGALLARELQRHKVHFVQAVYPNEAHGQHEAAAHFQQEREHFLSTECFV